MIELDAKLVTLTANVWEGRAPAPGEFLMSPGPRARNAYQVISFYPARRGAASVGRIKCWRKRKADVPKGARIHWWEWSKR